MSGGAKKKPTKTQGWEEAGSEFYQESYPAADGELDVFQKDPQHLATLLPSKQTRAVTTLQATIRMRTNRSTSERTMRRQATLRSRKDSTLHRRASTTQDVQVSMLPDLSENISNEQTIWEEIMQIKTMPIPMAQKKELKAKILNQPNLRLQGYEQFKWKRRKLWKKFHTRLSEYYDKIEVWKGDLKTIEGRFGTGVVSYFLFLKWLLFLNIFIFAIIFTFITFPYVLWNPEQIESNYTNTTSSVCSEEINPVITVLNLVQGTGFMECTYLFYGYYPSEILNYSIGNANIFYNFPLAYVIVTLVYLIVSLMCMVKAGAKGFKERLIEGEGQFYLYCNMIFGGWDFCIHDAKSAAIKHQAIYNEIKGNLEAERIEDERQNRTSSERTKLYLIRILVNSVVVGILIFCGCAIYFIFSFCTEKLKEFIEDTLNYEKLFYEFLPSLTIVGLNMVIPFIFRYLIIFENYSPIFVVRLTLFRTVFLRMAALIVFYASLYAKITCKGDKCRSSTKCWETYVGQQIYKLFLTDFVSTIMVTFFINFPRSLIAKHFNNKFCTFIGAQTFDLPKHVLDVVYTQTLVWIGCFYTPLLSFMAVIHLFCIFYVKKFACLFNSEPSGIIYRVSRSNSMFMIVLLVSFVFALLPLMFSVSELVPSSSCGPFQNVPYVWYTVQKVFYDAPKWLQDFISFLSTAGFAVPVLMLLSLLLYYYTAVNSANRHMVKVLRNQLVLEGHDKQFLLERLSMFIKQQQENQKRMRRIEMAQEAERNKNSS